MQKITVMIPVECEVSVHPSGRIRVEACKNPLPHEIEDHLKAVPQAEVKPWHNIISRSSQDRNYFIVQK